MPLSAEYEEIIKLIRFGIGHAVSSPPHAIDWEAMEALAARQGVWGVMVDVIDKLPESLRPPKYILLPWVGVVMQRYERRYEHYRRAIAEMAGFYNAHGFKMMVLKGYACSLNWPRPEHRPAGDIDIWQFGKQKEADAALACEMGVKINLSHHHHTVFYWREFMVENHYDFINVHTNRSSRRLEAVLKDLGRDDSHCVELFGEKVYLPSANLHALFLLSHLASHFVAVKITLRQVLDWAFFVEKQEAEVDWGWLIGVLEEYHMRDFMNCINAICVENLGFEKEVFPDEPSDPKLKDRVLCDILAPEFSEVQPKGLLPRVMFKYRRWRANEWKRRLCYSESPWSAFWSGVWSHLLKPGSI